MKNETKSDTDGLIGLFIYLLHCCYTSWKNENMEFVWLVNLLLKEWKTILADWCHVRPSVMCNRVQREHFWMKMSNYRNAVVTHGDFPINITIMFYTNDFHCQGEKCDTFLDNLFSSKKFFRQMSHNGTEICKKKCGKLIFWRTVWIIISLACIICLMNITVKVTLLFIIIIETLAIIPK